MKSTHQKKKVVLLIIKTILKKTLHILIKDKDMGVVMVVVVEPIQGEDILEEEAEEIMKDVGEEEGEGILEEEEDMEEEQKMVGVMVMILITSHKGIMIITKSIIKESIQSDKKTIIPIRI